MIKRIARLFGREVLLGIALEILAEEIQKKDTKFLAFIRKQEVREVFKKISDLYQKI